MNPFSAVTELGALGALDAPLSTNNGESLAISPIRSHPHLLLKRYKTELTEAEVARLDRLIALPTDLVPADRGLLCTATSWPTVRVVADGASIGCVIPRAPVKFLAHLRGPDAPPAPLEIDWVSVSPHRRQRIGLPTLELAHRLRISANLLAVAALFERHDLVYADWSYANAFWSAYDGDVFVIDTDSCAGGSRTAVKTPNFDDPVPREDTLVDGDTDRYRVALLVGRCLTGERDYGAVLGGLDRLPVDVRVLLDQSLTAARRADRAKIADLWLAVQAVADAAPTPSWPVPTVPARTPVRTPARTPVRTPVGSNVVGWTSLPGRPPEPVRARRKRRWPLQQPVGGIVLAILGAGLLILLILIAAEGF